MENEIIHILAAIYSQQYVHGGRDYLEQDEEEDDLPAWKKNTFSIYEFMLSDGSCSQPAFFVSYF